jgi:hypothetical protein
MNEKDIFALHGTVQCPHCKKYLLVRQKTIVKKYELKDHGGAGIRCQSHPTGVFRIGLRKKKKA